MNNTTQKEREGISNFVKAFYKKYGRFPTEKQIAERITNTESQYYTKLRKYKL